MLLEDQGRPLLGEHGEGSSVAVGDSGGDCVGGAPDGEIMVMRFVKNSIVNNPTIVSRPELYPALKSSHTHCCLTLEVATVHGGGGGGLCMYM